MDITNTISRDSSYSNIVSSEIRIEQSALEIENSHFKNKMSKLDTIESIGNIKKSNRNDDISKSIDKSNKKLQAFDRKLEISVHKKTREVMIKVIDTSTDEIIREIPPEKVLDIIASRQEIVGVLMDKKI